MTQRLHNVYTTFTQRLHNVYTTFGVALYQDTTQVSRHNARIKSDTTQVNKSGGRAANAALPGGERPRGGAVARRAERGLHAGGARDAAAGRGAL